MACTFGETWSAAQERDRHPRGCKACWDNAGEPQREPELALDCPRCLLGVPAVPQVMLAISGRVLMDTGHSYMRNDTDNLVGCTINSPELVSDSALDLLAVQTLPLGSVVVEFEVPCRVLRGTPTAESHPLWPKTPFQRASECPSCLASQHTKSRSQTKQT